MSSQKVLLRTTVTQKIIRLCCILKVVLWMKSEGVTIKMRAVLHDSFMVIFYFLECTKWFKFLKL